MKNHKNKDNITINTISAPNEIKPTSNIPVENASRDSF